MNKNPCYDEETKTDCSKRCVGCSTICALWHRYVEERDKGYEDRKQQSKFISAEITAQDRKTARIRKNKRR